LSPAAHPRATFIAARRGAPGSSSFERNQGVPVSAILFCGGHARSLPLVYEAKSWRHGVFVGATLTSEGDNPDQPRHDQENDEEGADIGARPPHAPDDDVKRQASGEQG